MGISGIGILSRLLRHLIAVFLLTFHAEVFGPRPGLQTARGAWGCVLPGRWEVSGPVPFTKWVEIKPLSSLHSLDISLDFCQLNS